MGGVRDGPARPALGDDPAEERRLDRAHDEAVPRGVVQQVAGVQVLGGRDRPRRGAAAGLDQEEHLPDARARAGDGLGDVGELVQVRAHHGRVDLHVEARGDERLDRRDGVREVPGRDPHALVGGRRRAVEADRHRPHPAAGDPRHHVGRQAGRHGRGEGGGDAEVHGAPDQVEQVGARQAVAAGEDEDRVRPAEPGDLVDQRQALGGAQLARERLGQGAGAAVPAGDAARPGDLPEHQHRALREVDLRPGRAGRGVVGGGGGGTGHGGSSASGGGRDRPRR